jgi:hypothetical protein
MDILLPIALAKTPFGLPTDIALKGVMVDLQHDRIQVVYSVRVKSPDDTTVIQTYDGQYVITNASKNSLHQVRGLTPEQLPRLNKVDGDGKFDRWVNQLSPAIVPAIAAEVQELLNPSAETPTDDPIE